MRDIRGKIVILVNFEEYLNPNVICFFKGTLGILGPNFVSNKLLMTGITQIRQEPVNKVILDNNVGVQNSQIGYLYKNGGGSAIIQGLTFPP